MNIYPAIDLKGGRAVRLQKGDMDKMTVFHDTPWQQAVRFVEQGAQWLHLVDLDGAFSGRSENADAVRAILKAVDVPIQLGGGIRDLEAIDYWLDLGIRRVILGTAAVKNPALVHEACAAYPGRIVVGIDARDGMVAIEGWAQTSDISARALGKQFEAAGVAAIVFTDIDRDGMMGGVNWVAVGEMAEALSLPIIASGGVSGPEDIEDLRRTAKATKGVIDGVIIGRALYDGALDLGTAIRAVSA